MQGAKDTKDWDWGTVRAAVMLITPQLAQEFLDHNTRNREVRPQKVRVLNLSVKVGGWFLVPDAIGFDWHGVLMNGQHRLLHIVESGVARQCVVVFGLDPAAWSKIDRQSVRTFADSLHTEYHEPNARGLQSALRLLFKYETTRDMTYNSGSAYVLDEQMLDLLDRYPGIRDAVRFGKNQGPKVALGALTPSFAAVAYHCFSVAQGVENADEFFGELVRPPAGGQVEVLYDRLAKHIAAKARGTGSGDIIDERRLRAFVIITFNKWIAGEQMSQISWKPGGARPQPFPLVDGYPFP